MLSFQANLLAIVYIIIIVIAIITTIIQDIKLNKSGLITSWVIFSQIIGLFIWLIFVVLLIYDTDCLTTGNCNVWSWIRTILYLILPVLGIVFTILGFRQLAKETQQLQYTMPVYSETQ